MTFPEVPVHHHLHIAGTLVDMFITFRIIAMLSEKDEKNIFYSTHLDESGKKPS